MTGCPGLGTENPSPLDKVLSIFIVPEYLTAFYPTNRYMVQNSGSI